MRFAEKLIVVKMNHTILLAVLPNEDLSGGIGSFNRKRRVFFTKGVGKACGFMPDDGSGSTEVRIIILRSYFNICNFLLQYIYIYVCVCVHYSGNLEYLKYS